MRKIPEFFKTNMGWVTRYPYWLAVVGGIVQGFSGGFQINLLSLLVVQYLLSSTFQSIATGSILVGGIVGGYLSRALNKSWSTRNVLLSGAIGMVLAFGIIGLPVGGIYPYVTGRFLLGVAVTVFTGPIAGYVSEQADPRWRDLPNRLYRVGVNLGLLVGTFMGLARELWGNIDWHWMALEALGLSLVLGTVAVVGMKPKQKYSANLSSMAEAEVAPSRSMVAYASILYIALQLGMSNLIGTYSNEVLIAAGIQQAKLGTVIIDAFLFFLSLAAINLLPIRQKKLSVVAGLMYCGLSVIGLGLVQMALASNLRSATTVALVVSYYVVSSLMFTSQLQTWIPLVFSAQTRKRGGANAIMWQWVANLLVVSGYPLVAGWVGTGPALLIFGIVALVWLIPLSRVPAPREEGKTSRTWQAHVRLGKATKKQVAALIRARQEAKHRLERAELKLSKVTTPKGSEKATKALEAERHVLQAVDEEIQRWADFLLQLSMEIQEQLGASVNALAQVSSVAQVTPVAQRDQSLSVALASENDELMVLPPQDPSKEAEMSGVPGSVITPDWTKIISAQQDVLDSARGQAMQQHEEILRDTLQQKLNAFLIRQTRENDVLKGILEDKNQQYTRRFEKKLQELVQTQAGEVASIVNDLLQL